MRSLVDSEYSQVWRRCLFAPIPVVLNGRAVNRPFFGLPKTITSMPSSTRIMNIVHPQEPHQYADVRFLTANKFEPGLIVGPTALALSGRDWFGCSDFPTPSPSFKGVYPIQAGEELPRLRVSGLRCVGCHVALARLKSGMFSESLGWLAFIKDGVVLSKAWNPIPSMRDWCLLVNAQNLTTDLSEFGVIQDDPYRQAVANLESIAKAAHKKP